MHAGFMNLTITFLSPIEVMAGISSQSYPIAHLKLSRRTGSYNLYHFRMSLWMRAPSTGRLTMYSFIRTLLPVGHLTDHLRTAPADDHPYRVSRLGYGRQSSRRPMESTLNRSQHLSPSFTDRSAAGRGKQSASAGWRSILWDGKRTSPSLSRPCNIIDLDVIQRQGLTWTVDNSVIARAQFRNLGKLANNASTAYGPMQQ